MPEGIRPHDPPSRRKPEPGSRRLDTGFRRADFRRALVALLVAVAAVPAAAEPTRLTVRILSKDAKFIGTSMGGVRVSIRDADTGEILAEGIARGGTGDTARIMGEGRRRGQPLATPDAASFTAMLDLEEPRRVEVVAFGPLAQLQAAAKVSATQWLLPGKHVDQGDGLLLVMPGLAVDVLSPPAHARLGAAPLKVPLRANLTML